MSTTFNRSELAARLAQAVSEVPVPQVEEAVRILTNTLAESLAAGERIEVRDFGDFSLRTHTPRLARNPKTGEPVEIGPRCVPHFKPGKELRDRINQICDLGHGSRLKPNGEDFDNGSNLMKLLA